MRELPYPMIAVEDAIAIILVNTAPLPEASVPLADALGLVLAADVHATRAAAALSRRCGRRLCPACGHGDLPRRLIGEQTAGYVADLQVQPGTAVRITTGAPIPAGGTP